VARERRLENRRGVRRSEQRGEESLGKIRDVIAEWGESGCSRGGVGERGGEGA